MASALTSSSTLWAQASKEWVIPAKPKPGRKPKKDPPAPLKEEGIEPTDSKGRRVQNRAAQRAFRERKQSQLADLQARVQSYEQGEMERNVALQNIAKRLKEENESLRRENTCLREELRKLGPGRPSDSDRKRWREVSNAPSTSDESTTRKRIKMDPLSNLSPPAVHSTMSLLPSPTSLVSSPESVESTASSAHNDPYSPMSFPARSPNPPAMYAQHPQPAMASLFSSFSGKVPGCTNENRAPSSFEQFDMVDCGFCSDDTPCVCRELAIQQVAARIAVPGEIPGSSPSIPTNSTSTAPMGSLSPPEIKMESRGSVSIGSTPQLASAAVPMNTLSTNGDTSILDNLPAYSPPVPLPRRRSAPQGSTPSIFPVYPAQSIPSRPLHPPRSSPANCSGDPSNCLACADDPFGKAFCAALGGSVKSCATCPNIAPKFRGCGGCGNPSICGGGGSVAVDRSSSGAQILSSSSSSSSSAPASSTSLSASGGTIPCNTAWAQLKSHPNIAFADLALLAEVVARRSKCNGPRVVLSPDPELEAFARRESDRRASADRGSDDMPVLLTDPHAQYHQRIDQPRGSPPQEMILQCGRQRVLEVEAEGVRDALALLDGQFRRS